MLESFIRKAVGVGLHRPVFSAIVIGSGALAGFQLGRQGRIVAAVAIALTMSGVAALAAWLLTRRMRTAERAALRDPLTGLPNRQLLDDRIDQALARSRRTGESFALLVIDLDGFKAVNDVWGHEAGNGVLRTIARRLQAAVRESDTVARVGGDEFVILSLGTQEDAEAAALVGRLRTSLRRAYRINGSPVELDASVGWALFPQDGVAPGELLAQADGQMYATKRDTSDESVVERRPPDANVVRDLELALAHNEIVVHYQPIVDLRSGEVRAVEALVRRAHSDRLVGPSEFIPHADHPLRPRRGRRELGDRDRGRVRGEHRPLRQRRIRSAEELLLRIRLLDDRLDQEVRVHQLPDRRDPSEDLVRRGAALLVKPREALLHRCEAPLDRAGDGVVERHLAPGCGHDLGDARAHLARARDEHPLEDHRRKLLRVARSRCRWRSRRIE